jgi:Uncharacterized protein conserved in bacteria
MTPLRADTPDSAYAKLLSRFEQLEHESLHIVETTLADSRLKIHHTSSRVKTAESAEQKVQRIAAPDQSSCEDMLLALNDMVGLRIICLYRDDLPQVAEKLEDCLSILDREDKILDYSHSSAGYQSLHLVATLPDRFAGTRYDAIKGMRFEIQIRTICMDAWASISHHLAYKQEDDVPPELRRSFLALAGLFYVADTEFQLLNEKRSDAAVRLGDVAAKDPAALADLPITTDVLKAYLDASPGLQKRDHARLDEVQDLAEELRFEGFETIGEVDRLMKEHWSAFLRVEAVRVGNGWGQFMDIGAVRVLLRDSAHRLPKRTGKWRSQNT